MLYSFILNFVETFSFLNVFKYLTVRTGLAMFTSMFVVFLIGNPFISFFSTKQILNPIREDGPSDHIIKKLDTTTPIRPKRRTRFPPNLSVIMPAIGPPIPQPRKVIAASWLRFEIDWFSSEDISSRIGPIRNPVV